MILARQWWGRRRPYLLAWAIGMGWYGLASGADAFGQLAGWSEATYRTWYLAGALMAAAWIGFVVVVVGHFRAVVASSTTFLTIANRLAAVTFFGLACRLAVEESH